MRKLSLSLLLLFSLSALAFEVPSLKSRVNDYAGVISSDMKGKLESLLGDYEKKTGNQFLILTVDSIQDAGTIEQYGIAVADKWKAGKKKEDNGLILIVAVKDRKVRFEVGYGLEGKLPDVVAFRIIRQKIIPAFRDGDYSTGVAVGVVYAIKSIGGYDLGKASGDSRTVAGADASGNSGKLKKSDVIRVIVIIIFIAASIVFRFIFGFGGFIGGGRRHGGSGWGGLGGFGSGGGFSGGFGGGGGGGFGGGGASGSW